jgi:hypothetical protein
MRIYLFAQISKGICSISDLHASGTSNGTNVNTSQNIKTFKENSGQFLLRFQIDVEWYVSKWKNSINYQLNT